MNERELAEIRFGDSTTAAAKMLDQKSGADAEIDAD